eukprot:TRINITY_DN1800_c1_g1_i1.p1 TRINITY_DN1800_c1_g1~~TRINITY_DN1800_c1_g1_i1.p1  ORF type:complete len:551 (+),score=133.88 TRINITY_DN1800_c1_g1_i1:42-1694(+)
MGLSAVLRRAHAHLGVCGMRAAAAYLLCLCAAAATAFENPQGYNVTLLAVMTLAGVGLPALRLSTVPLMALLVWVFGLWVDHGFRETWGARGWPLALPGLVLTGGLNPRLPVALGVVTVLYMVGYTTAMLLALGDEPSKVRDATNVPSLVLEGSVVVWAVLAVAVYTPPRRGGAASPARRRSSTSTIIVVESVARNPLAPPGEKEDAPTIRISATAETPPTPCFDPRVDSATAGEEASVSTWVSCDRSSGIETMASAMTPVDPRITPRRHRRDAMAFFGPAFERRDVTLASFTLIDASTMVKNDPSVAYNTMARFLAAAYESVAQEKGEVYCVKGDSISAWWNAFDYSPRHADNGLRCVTQFSNMFDLPATCAVATGMVNAAAFAGEVAEVKTCLGGLMDELAITRRTARTWKVRALCTDITVDKASDGRHELRLAMRNPPYTYLRTSDRDLLRPSVSDRYWELVCRPPADNAEGPSTPSGEWIYTYESSQCKTWVRYNAAALKYHAGEFTEAEVHEYLRDCPEEVVLHARTQLPSRKDSGSSHRRSQSH